MSKTILLGANLPGGPQRLIPESIQTILPDSDQEVMPIEQLYSHLPVADAVVLLLSQRMGAREMDMAPNLKVLSNYAVGYDNIDVAQATSRGILVTNTPDVLTETTADLAWALLMATARRIVEADRFVRQGRFDGWKPSLFLGRDVFGKTLGIIGLGRIGKAVARRAQGFGMQVLALRRRQSAPVPSMDGQVQMVELDELLKRSDFVSIHCPLTEQTRHLIGPAQFERMKSTAILVNTARGPVVDEQALIAALEQGRISGAGLDVYEQEPLVPDRLKKLDNVVLAPHIGSASHETREAMAAMAVQAAIDVLEGRKPAHPVNPEIWS